jgi:hypothetical protein
MEPLTSILYTPLPKRTKRKQEQDITKINRYIKQEDKR